MFDLDQAKVNLFGFNFAITFFEMLIKNQIYFFKILNLLLLIVFVFEFEHVVAQQSCLQLFDKSTESISKNQFHRNDKGNNKFYWLNQFEKDYSANLRQRYGTRKQTVSDAAYELAKRFQRSDFHARFLKNNFGYRLIKSREEKSERLVPPGQLTELLSHIKAVLERPPFSDSVGRPRINLVALFYPKNLDSLPDSIDKYIVKDLLRSESDFDWPDPEKYELVGQNSSDQIPSKVFLQLFSEGKIFLPFKSSFDHDMAHLTDILQGLQLFGTAYLDVVKKYNRKEFERASQQTEIEAFRENVLFEFFTIPDLTQKKLIFSLLSQWNLGSHTYTRVSDLRQQIYNQLIQYSHNDFNLKVTDFISEVEPLLYLMGGVARDSYNSRNGISRSELISKIANFKLPFSKTTRAQPRNKESSEFHYSTLKSLLSSLEDSLNIFSTEFEVNSYLDYIQRNEPNRISEFTADNLFLKKRFFVADLMSRILLGLNSGVNLNLDPSIILHEGLLVAPDVNSRLNRFLRSYLDSDDPLRKLFEGSTSKQ